ncbi:MAG: MFS transporter [Thioalkalispiraceae bacterium]|jgi:PAT family beta-lactamase induction signal transducer AmpG
MTKLFKQPVASWKEAFLTYTHPRVVTLFFLGFSAGLPLLLIFGTLSFWLARAGVDISTITYFSWAALGYSFKFVWAPLIDRLPFPVLHRLLGRRRSWLLVTQIMIAFAIAWMGLTQPMPGKLEIMAYAAVLLGFSAASQDIVIDAYRIEIAKKEYQAAMSAMYQAGYRIGMLVAGAGAFYLVSWFSQGAVVLKELVLFSSYGISHLLIGAGEQSVYLYPAWRWAYLLLAACMSVGILTTLLMPEPVKKAEVEKINQEIFHSTLDYVRFLFLFLITTGAFVSAFVYLNPADTIVQVLHAKFGVNGVLSKFTGQAIRLLISLTLAIGTAYLLVLIKAVDKVMVVDTYIKPVVDFTSRYKKTFIIVLLLIGFYRISDIVLGVVALIFYEKMGFSEVQIADISKTFGLMMIIVGGFLGGLLTARFGVLRILLIGAILAAATNILFMIFAQVGSDTTMFIIVIAADNLSAGLAGAAFIAYLSSLTNMSFTAMQYALFTSIMTLIPKLIAGYSGSIVENIGYEYFFLFTTILGIPVVLLIIYLIMYEQKHKTD